MKLHQKKSIMRAEEGKPKIEKSVGYAVYVYYTILIILLLYVGSYFISKAFTIKSEGIVEANSTLIQTPYTGIVSDINFTKKIKPHQFLCNIKESIKVITNQNPASSNSIVINLKMKLSLAKTNYIVSKKQYNIDLKQFNRVKKAQILGLIDIKDNIFQNILLKLKEDKLNIMNYKLQIQNYQNLLKQVDIHKTNNITIKYINHPIYAPIKGYLLQQNVFNGSVVKRGDVLATIQNFDIIQIVAKFPIDNISKIKQDTIFKIILPDGITKEGYVKSFIPNKNIIKTILIPLDKNKTFWKKYNLSNVKLKKVNLW